MRLAVIALALCAASPVWAQLTEPPPGARPLTAEMEGTWELVEKASPLDGPNDILWLHLRIVGDRITQSDSLRLADGEVVVREIGMECVLFDMDRSRIRPPLDPPVLHDAVACRRDDGDGSYRSPYGQYSVEGDRLTFSIPGRDETEYRMVFQRVSP